VEDYAAELKRLYDKAHSDRDAATRREDLLRRFLDGISDDRARFQVEYVKEPADIDEAVYEVVNFLETRRRPRETGTETHNKYARAVWDNIDSEVTTDGEVEREMDRVPTDRVARAPIKFKKGSALTKENSHLQDAAGSNGVQNSNAKSAVLKDTTEDTQEPLLSKIYAAIQDMAAREAKQPATIKAGKAFDRNRFGSDHGRGRGQGNYQGNQGYQAGNQRYQGYQQPPQPGYNTQGQRAQWGNNACFCCGEQGHFARECTNAPMGTGQMQMAVQPTGVPQGVRQPQLLTSAPTFYPAQAASNETSRPSPGPSQREAGASNSQLNC
jgi:hypothetical protein